MQIGNREVCVETPHSVSIQSQTDTHIRVQRHLLHTRQWIGEYKQLAANTVEGPAKMIRSFTVRRTTLGVRSS